MSEMNWPGWITWGNVWPVLASIPGWVALGLALKKHRREKTILAFTFLPTFVEGDEGEIAIFVDDDKAFVRALELSITNTGQQPITIQYVSCMWSGVNAKGEEFEVSSTAQVNKKPSEGDNCLSTPHLWDRPKAVLAVWAVDSTGKKWNAPSVPIKVFNTIWTGVWRLRPLM